MTELSDKVVQVDGMLVSQKEADAHLKSDGREIANLAPTVPEQVATVAKEAGPALTKRFVEVDGMVMPEAEYNAALAKGEDVHIHSNA